MSYYAEELRKHGQNIFDEDAANELDRLEDENSKLRELVNLIFASTLPYNDGEPTFSDKVTDTWRELTPNVEVLGATK